MSRQQIIKRLQQACSHSTSLAEPQALAVSTMAVDIDAGLDAAAIESWVAKLTAAQAGVEQISDEQGSLVSIEKFIHQTKQNKLVITPDTKLSVLCESLRNKGIHAEQRPIQPSDQTVVTVAYAGIIETGSLVMLSSPQTPAENNFLPENTIVLIYADRLLPDLESLWRLMQAEGQEMPRALTLVSGPSKTADIEQTLTYGAHGPKQLQVLLVKGESVNA